MNAIIRLKQFIDYKQISKYKFYKDTGLSNGYLDKNSSVGSDKCEIISSCFPDLSLDWLITGKGNMLKSNTQSKDFVGKHQDVETRPRIPLNAAAGALSVCLEGLKANQCEQIPIIGAFNRYDFTIMVRGESMEPYFLSGDELAGLYLTSSSFIQWGRSHILDTAQGILVKKIYDDNDSIICKSENPRFPDFKIPKSEVYNIALVIGLIRRY